MEGEGKKVQWDSNVSGRQMVVPPAKTGSIWRKTGLLVGEGAGERREGGVRGCQMMNSGLEYHESGFSPDF